MPCPLPRPQSPSRGSHPVRSRSATGVRRGCGEGAARVRSAAGAVGSGGGRGAGAPAQRRRTLQLPAPALVPAPVPAPIPAPGSSGSGRRPYPSALPLQQADDGTVGRVDDRIFQHRQVDLSRALGRMPQAGADDREGHVAVAGHRGPAVARRVGGEPAVVGQQARELAQLAVVAAQRRLVLAVGGQRLGLREDGKDVGGLARCLCIAVDQLADPGLDADAERLARLAAHVADRAVAHVRLAQEGDVDEGHAARAITEEEQIARQRQRTIARQIEAAQLREQQTVDGPLARAVHARVDPLERAVLRGEPQPHGLVVDGPEVAHVERAGVARDAPRREVGLILTHQLLGELLEGQLGAREELREAADRALVVLRRAEAPAASERLDLRAHEGRQRAAVRGRAEEPDHLPEGEPPPRALQLPHDPADAGHVAVDARLHRGRTVGAGMRPPLRGVPLLGRQVHAGGDLTRSPRCES